MGNYKRPPTQGQGHWYVPPSASQNNNGDRRYEQGNGYGNGNGNGQGQPYRQDLKRPRTPLEKFADRISDVTRELGFELVGTITVRPVSVEDEDALIAERYLLDRDEATGATTIRWGRVKVNLPGLMNGVDTTGFTSTVANRVTMLQDAGVRFIEQEIPGGWDIQAVRGNRTIERQHDKREMAFASVCAQAFAQKWHNPHF